MYVPPLYDEQRLDEIHRIVREHPLGTLVTNGPAGLDATHLPFEFDPEVGAHGLLQAHVARANPVWQQQRDGDAVLVIFHGAHAYVSPNWYPSKHEFHRQVPTWNYQVVHAHGTLRIRDDEKFVRGVVARLTRTHEARAAEPKPWKMGDSEAAYIDKLLGLIVGIEVELTRLVGVSKLNQNKEARDRAGVTAALAARDQAELADAMVRAAPPTA